MYKYEHRKITYTYQLVPMLVLEVKASQGLHGNSSLHKDTPQTPLGAFATVPTNPTWRSDPLCHHPLPPSSSTTGAYVTPVDHSPTLPDADVESVLSHRRKNTKKSRKKIICHIPLHDSANTETQASTSEPIHNKCPSWHALPSIVVLLISCGSLMNPRCTLPFLQRPMW